MKTPLWFVLAFLAASAGSAQQTDVPSRVRRPATVRSIDVRATLDRDGKLHIVERQRLRISGRNDGAKRTIVRPLRGIDLVRISRVEEETLVPLTKGDLTAPEQFDFERGASTILWTFDDDSPDLTFQIEYSTVNAVVARPGGYGVNYDPVPPTPYGEIRALLTLDPSWSILPDGVDGPIDLTVPVDKRPLLRYTGGGDPAWVPDLPAENLRRNLTWAIAAACFILFLLFVRHEWSSGRLRRAPSPTHLNASVLRNDLLSLFPQLEQPGGTADDRKVLARMIESGRILIHLYSGFTDYLHLLLACPREQLTAEERKVAALLFGSRSVASTHKLRQPHRSRMTPRDATHWSTRVVVVLMWILFTVGGCYAGGVATTAEILYQVFSIALTPLFLIAVSQAGSARWYADGPMRIVGRAVGFGAIPPIAVTLLINQDRVLLPPTLYFSAAILAVSTFADALQAARSSREDEGSIRQRQRAIAVAREIERRWKTSEKIAAHDLRRGAYGFKARQSIAGCFLALLATGLLITALVIQSRGDENVGNGLFGLSFITLLVAILASAKTPARAGALQAAADPLPPRAAMPAVEARGWAGQVSETSIGVSAEYGPYTWTLTSEPSRLIDEHSDRPRRTEPFTLWRSNEGAVAGTLVFRPRHVSAHSAGALVQWLGADAGISWAEMRYASPLPVDDEHLLLHYDVVSSENLTANHISPTLRATLARLGHTLRDEGTHHSLRALMVIAFNSHGTVLVSNAAVDSEAALGQFATAGLRLAAALRPDP